jgi:hypothetical protein
MATIASVNVVADHDDELERKALARARQDVRRAAQTTAAGTRVADDGEFQRAR